MNPASAKNISRNASRKSVRALPDTTNLDVLEAKDTELPETITLADLKGILRPLTSETMDDLDLWIEEVRRRGSRGGK